MKVEIDFLTVHEKVLLISSSNVAEFCLACLQGATLELDDSSVNLTVSHMPPNFRVQLSSTPSVSCAVRLKQGASISNGGIYDVLRAHYGPLHTFRQSVGGSGYSHFLEFLEDEHARNALQDLPSNQEFSILFSLHQYNPLSAFCAVCFWFLSQVV